MWMQRLPLQLVLILLKIYPTTPLIHSSSPSSSSPECHNLSLVEYHVMLQGKEVDCIESLRTFRGYDPSLDPYSLYIGNMPVKILFSITFNHSTDFLKACDKFKRALTIVLEFIFKCSYSHSSELYARVFDKLVRDLIASELVAWIQG